MRLGRIGVIILTLVSATLAAALLLSIRERTKTRVVTVAAGAASGESYLLAQALKTVTEARYPNIHLSVVETAGTAENLRLLEQRRVEFAAAQADVPVGPSARIIAVLYDDTFQLLVHNTSSIHAFADLRGRRIALPQAGGQYQSFLSVAEHFGIGARDCTFVGADEDSSDRAFVSGEADAVFRVRALGNPAIVNL